MSKQRPRRVSVPLARVVPGQRDAYPTTNRREGYVVVSRGLRLPLLLVCLLLPACQQKMARQPSYRPLEPSAFFPDGRSARPLVSGTVSRQQYLIGDPMITARKPGKETGPVRPEDYVKAFPFPINREVLERGQERFQIFCAVCHDDLGTGNGKIVERGYLKPPSFHTSNSRGFERRGIKVKLASPDFPVGYYFEVITDGYGGMPSYASQIPPRDRWCIIAHVRTLQLSQQVTPLEQLPKTIRTTVERSLADGSEAEGRP
jgi:hypothetical protein